MSLLAVPTIGYNERRYAQRARVQFRVDCCPLVPTAQGMVAVTARRCVATDLSVTGIFLRDATPLKVGANVRLIVRLPDDPRRPLICYARVVRNRQSAEGSGHGLMFSRVAESYLERIDRFVLTRLTRHARLRTVPRR